MKFPANQYIRLITTDDVERAEPVEPGDDLIIRIQALPQELQDDIQGVLLRSMVAPGKVFFGTNIGSTVSTSILNIRNHAFHQKVLKLLFEDNTWVFPAGALPRFHFLERLPRPLLANITSMEITFAWDEASSLPPTDRTTYTNRRVAYCRRVGKPVDEYSISIAYLARRIDCQMEAYRIWCRKFDIVAKLRLRHLKLDFTAAFIIYDGFLADILVESTLPRFLHGLPKRLEIVASNEARKNQIRGVFVGKNVR